MPRPVAVFTHPDCLLHDTGPHHPERPERLTACREALEGAAFAGLLHWDEPEPAPACWIEAIHSPEYRQYIEEACLKGKPFADFGDTVISPESYRAACLAAGSGLAAVDAVLKGGYGAAFCLVRPPGHHASSEQAMGFCLFNNAAIAAHYAQAAYGMERVGIIDWDVHHGNGTQDIFYGSPSVLFCSLHQLPLYPHSGECHETGSGAGRDLTLNCPVPRGSGIESFLEALEMDIEPRLEAFRPELLILSAGFDAHREDPLADLMLESSDYHALTLWLRRMASRFTHDRVVSLLEGGYHLPGLAESVVEHLRGLVADSGSPGV